jgi:hypothetical protein
MRALLLTALLALCACAHVTPPAPEPGPPDPEPGPAATACERSCARAAELDCNGAGPNCVEACERYEALGGELARNPECQAKAATCEQRDACRSGYP